MKFIKYLIVMLAVQQIGFADVHLSLDNYNESTGTVDVNFTSDEDISGLQFEITGADITDADGGEAGANGFVLSTSATTVLGFSFSGATIPAGSGLLLTIVIENISGIQVCLANPVMAGGSGTITTMIGDCLTVGDLPGCMDANACNYNPASTADDGSCEYPEENFNCSGDCLIEVDCNGDCGGNAQLDVCGNCGGSETDANNCVDGYSLSFGSIDESAGTIEILYSAEAPLGGVQFDVTGANLTGASGGEAESSEWTQEANQQTYLGFSLNGVTIPQGNRVLAFVNFTSDGLGGDICFNADQTFLSGPTGTALDFTIGECVSLPGNEDLLSIMFDVDHDISGFQFDVDGVTLLGASGGEAAANNFTVQTGTSGTVLGFSFSGDVVPGGSGVLTNLDIFGFAENGCIDESSLVISADGGEEIDAWVTDCNTITYCADEDADGICDSVDDCVGTVDACGVCNGDGSDDLGCGCFEPGPSGCDNTCGSTLEDDACGVCGGSATNPLECYEFGLFFENFNGPAGTADIVYVSSEEVGGAQFNVQGISLIGASGGAADDADWTVSTSATTWLGFSFQNIALPAGTHTLSTITFEPISVGEACLSGSVLSGITGNDFGAENGPCADASDLADNVSYSLGAFSQNGLSGSVELLYDATVDVGGLQFSVSGGSLNGSNGGAVESTDWTVSINESTWVGFSFSAQTIPAGSGVVASLEFTIDAGATEFCANEFVSTDDVGNEIESSGAGCITLEPVSVGCTDESATNYDSEADLDDGSCDFPPIEIDEPEELESYDSSVDIDVPEVVFEEVEVDIDIPAGALDVPEGTEVTLEASEVSEDELQNIVDSSSSADADVEVYQGVSFEATDENGDPIELNEGATLDVEMTFDPTRDEFDLGYITEDGEIVALGANCFDNGDGTWTCVGDGPGFGSYIVYSYDPASVIEGCTLMAACNFDSEATMNDGSCTWATGLFDCDGNCTTSTDCDGECGGSAIEDECGVCEGNGPDEYYDCAGACLNDADGDSVCDELEVLGCTDESATNYDSEATEDDGTCESGFDFTHELGFGNNLISFPGYLENDSSQDLLEGLMAEGPNVVFLLGQGVGLFNTANGWSGNLNNIASTSGYWLNVQGSHDWDLEFTSGLEACTPYDISFGNNLLSYKWGNTNANTLVALGGETSATENFNFILGQGVGLFNTANGWSGNLNQLEQGKGYWVNITNSSIDFRWGFDSCDSEAIQSNETVELEKQLPEEFQFVQSTEQAFYLLKDIQVDGTQPQEEDIVLAYNNDILVGSAIWTGEYTAVPVMGKDVSGLTDGFCEVGDNVEFKLYQHNSGNMINLTGQSDNWNSLLVTHVEKLSGSTHVELPSSLTLNPAFPNPFNPVTTISYGIPTDGMVNVAIYDVNGRMIESLVNGFTNVGRYSLDWNADTQPSGMYFLKVQFGNEVKSEKIMLVK